MARERSKSIHMVRDVACRFNVFRKSIRNTTILFVVVIAYVMLGGLLFYYLEGPGFKELSSQNNTVLEMMSIVERLWNRTSDLEKDDWMKFTLLQMDSLRQLQYDLDMRSRWNYLSACFFCITVVSTIGYGTITPVTVTGRFVCIFYAIFGIPLFVVFLAKLGKLISVPLKYTHRRINERYKCCKTFIVQRKDEISSVVQLNSKHNPDRTQNANQSVTTRTPSKTLDSMGPEEKGTLIADDKTSDSEIVMESFDGDEEKAGDEATVMGDRSMYASSEDINRGWENKNVKHANSVDYKNNSFSSTDKDDIYDVVKDDYENAPVTFVVVVLLLYLATGSAILMWLEETWSYIDAVYFSIITFTTIGFGDITPADQHGKLTDEEVLARQTFVSCYIVFGLVVMAIALNLARDQLKSKVRTFVKEQNGGTRRCRQCLPACVCTQNTEV